VWKSASGDEGVDLEGLIIEAVRQIPEGMVSTFGDLAKALGDIVAARAVGTVLASLPCDTDVPHHRVLYSDGRISNTLHDGKGNVIGTMLLGREGVPLADGKVQSLDAIRFRDFDIEPVLIRLREEQGAMRSLVVDSDAFGNARYVAGLDVSYASDGAVAALVTMDLRCKEVVEEKVMWGETRFPYIPGYLGYREMPLAKRIIEPCEDTIYLVDGQGVLHPRGFGVACHIGVGLGVPTIGAAKSLLLGDLQEESGEILVDGRTVGKRIQPEGRRKTFVSVGHRVSLATACEVCQDLILRGAPEPLRLAHMKANRERKRREAKE